MSYLDSSVRQFLGAVASAEPAPGGGAVAAVTAALAAALVAMAARFSAARLAGAGDLAARADRLREQVAPLADEDAAAYRGVLAAYALPKQQGSARREKIRGALRQAAEVPLRVAELGAEAADLGAELAVGGNPNLRGDAVSAVLTAEAAVASAACLVRINAELGRLGDGLPEAADRYVQQAAGAAQRAGAR